jgi:hypothetical protein
MRPSVMEARIAARAVMTRLSLPWLVRLLPLPATLEAISPRATPSGEATAPVERVERALARSQWLVQRMRVVPNTCLYRALARYAMLRRAGHAARFVMGLDPRRSDVLGHAWVELDGRPLGEDVDPHLVVTYSYP